MCHLSPTNSLHQEYHKLIRNERQPLDLDDQQNIENYIPVPFSSPQIMVQDPHDGGKPEGFSKYLKRMKTVLRYRSASKHHSPVAPEVAAPAQTMR